MTLDEMYREANAKIAIAYLDVKNGYETAFRTAVSKVVEIEIDVRNTSLSLLKHDGKKYIFLKSRKLLSGKPEYYIDGEVHVSCIGQSEHEYPYYGNSGWVLKDEKELKRFIKAVEKELKNNDMKPWLDYQKGHSWNTIHWMYVVEV